MATVNALSNGGIANFMQFDLTQHKITDL